MSATAAPPPVSVRASRTDDFPVPAALATRPAPGWPGTALAVSLLAAIAYAAFDHGAAGQVAQARLSTALALVAVAAGVLWLWHGGLRTEAPRAAWVGIAMFIGFAIWTGLTLSWSISPGGTWTELNRVIAYALVTVLALAAAAWDRRVLGRVAVGYLVIVTVVALYSLGGKALPGVSIGPIDLDQTSFFSRLRAPLDYWNGLAIFVVLAVPIALRLAADRDRAVSARIASLISLALMLITVALTYSRGGVLALVFAVGVSIWLGGARLRSLGLLGLAALSAAPALAYSLTSKDLTGLLVPLKDRESSGFLFLLLLVAGLIMLAIGARVAISADERNAITPARAHAIARLLFAAVGVAIVLGLGALAVSDRGLTGSISHQAHEFTKAKGEAVSDPNRLLSTSSGNRWVWWREAAGAWSDRPLEGWGAGTFPLLHRQYRRNRLEVLQPHSVPLQLLSETGLVGAVLALGGVLALLAAAIGGVRRLAPGPERGIAAALAGATLGWLVHGLVDWDWDLPATSLPAFVFLGLLAGHAAHSARSTQLTPPAGAGGRLLALAAVTLLLCAVATSAIVPAWATGEVDAALASVSRHATPAELRDVQRRLDRAARIDRLSVDPLLSAAAIARRRGDGLAARRYLLQAAGREPDRGPTWLAIANLETSRGDLSSAREALRRALDLDPYNRGAPPLIAALATLQAPSSESPTATGTPLPSFQPGNVPGGTVLADGSLKLPDGSIVRRDGSIKKPDGTIVPPAPELSSAIGVAGK